MADSTPSFVKPLRLELIGGTYEMTFQNDTASHQGYAYIDSNSFMYMAVPISLSGDGFDLETNGSLTFKPTQDLGVITKHTDFYTAAKAKLSGTISFYVLQDTPESWDGT